MKWLIEDEKGNSISNFLPDVLSIIRKKTDDNAESETFVKLRLSFGENQQSEVFFVPLSNLDTIDWFLKDRRVRFHPSCSKVKANRYIEDNIRLNLVNAPEENLYYINRLGTHVIENIPMFYTGGQLIFPTSIRGKPNIELKKLPYRLAIDPDLTELESINVMIELISLSPDAIRIILSYTLLYIMRDVYKSVWKAPCFSVFLYGKTGSKKTTISAFLTQIYDRDKGIENPQRLNASIPKAEELLYEKCDCVVVLDDLFPTDFNDMKNQQEKTLLEITRIIADGISRGRKGSRISGKPPKCGVLFTGEYVIGTGSSAARLLPVELYPSPDNDKLKKFQDNPLMVSTFYYFFIKWYIDNYFIIQKYLKAWRDAYQKEKIIEHDRLQEIHYFLNTAYTLFLQYCYEKNYISEQNTQYLFKSFHNLLTVLVQEQQFRINQGTRIRQNDEKESSRTDYILAFKIYYKNNGFNLANNPDEFLYNDKCDGVVHNGYLCLRSTKFQMILRKLGIPDNVDRVLNALELKGALIRGKDKRAKQISTTNGKRFYFIPLEKLK